jgi:RNA polymerase sigma factor (sigma-70 family)
MQANPELIRAAQAGDRKALENLLAVSRVDIQRVAKWHCVSDGDAEDATQETLWIMYRRIGGLQTITSFPAWTFSIVRRECNRLWRKMRNETELPPDDSPLFAYRPEIELRSDLAAAIHSLPDKYRTVIVLRDIRELSIGEIAIELGFSRAAVKSRIHRGRRMIREYLHD